MWNDNMVQDLFTDHGRGLVAPRRHEIARRAYVEKISARHEAEQRAATIGAVAKVVSNLRALAKSMYAVMQSSEKQASPTAAKFPAE